MRTAAAPERRAAVAARREELTRQPAASGLTQLALRPDPMGLG